MNAKKVHLVGIGGIGLSAIARLLLARGVQVSGSDLAVTTITQALEGAGAHTYQGHKAENLEPDVDLVVVTSAAGEDNPEVVSAKAKGIRIVRRREVLGELTEGYQTIAVGGSHGKTTTTALIGLMLAEAGLDPMVIVGGMVEEFGSNARIGKGDYFVIEADEYDNAFLGLQPYVEVITNVDYDHPDMFTTRQDYLEAFVKFASRVRVDGALIVCGDDSGSREVGGRASSTAITYGLSPFDDWRAVELRPNSKGGTDFGVVKHGEIISGASSRIPGRHNVDNALAALAACDTAGVPIERAVQALERFGGVARRFQVLGECRGVTLVDDYAHHPSEIRATLAAARDKFGTREIWAVFQPHTFSRTRALLNEFALAFDAADHVVVTEVYAAREHDTLGISGRDLVAAMKHEDARFIAAIDDVYSFVTSTVGAGSVLISLGAGDVNSLVRRLAEMGNGDRPAS